VSGSRLIGGSSELHGGFDEFLRLAGSSLITACINYRFKVRLSESQNGFRAIRTAVLKSLELRENSTTIEQEMVIKTLKQGYRMAEVPAHEHERRHGVSHIRLWRVSARYVYTLVKNLFF
jgi:dolichol-phosphate mannosyltransferase